MLVNGEKRDIEIRGRIRPIDISSDNTIISSRLANAEINYDGEGFATRSAKPGLLNRIFSFLGL
jgi:flagellar L-ring protein precursor FlgH